MSIEEKTRAPHDPLSSLRKFILNATVDEVEDVTARKYFFQEMIEQLAELQRHGKLEREVVIALRQLITENVLFHANPPQNYTLIPPTAEPKYKIAVNGRDVATNKSTSLAVAFLDKSLEYLSYFEPSRIWEGQHSSVESELHQVFQQLQENYPQGHIPNMLFRDIGESMREFLAREREALVKEKMGTIGGGGRKDLKKRNEEKSKKSTHRPFPLAREYESLNISDSFRQESVLSSVIAYFSPSKSKEPDNPKLETTNSSADKLGS